MKQWLIYDHTHHMPTNLEATKNPLEDDSEELRLVMEPSDNESINNTSSQELNKIVTLPESQKAVD